MKLQFIVTVDVSNMDEQKHSTDSWAYDEWVTSAKKEMNEYVPEQITAALTNGFSGNAQIDNVTIVPQP